MAKIAVVLFNLGGPDGPDAVQPFLFNLFNDPAIIGAPGPLRWLLAKLISVRRAPVAREIYDHLGGGSPLLDYTRDQAAALQAALGDVGEVKTFICMRYWHPRADEAVAAVKAFAPDRMVLLPLYPQFSTTTTASSFGDWDRAAANAGLDVPTRRVCCYPCEPGWIAAQIRQIRDAVTKGGGPTPMRYLFSAHGLPQKIVDAGDPYQWQVEQTAAALAHGLDLGPDDWVVCYQSRVGPLKWLAPSIDDEIARAAADEIGVCVVPIAFVSEHSETLVELDVEYRKRADAEGVPAYVRAATVDTDAAFIAGLAGLIRGALDDARAVAPGAGHAGCPANWRKCACRAAGKTGD